MSRLQLDSCNKRRVRSRLSIRPMYRNWSYTKFAVKMGKNEKNILDTYTLEKWPNSRRIYGTCSWRLIFMYSVFQESSTPSSYRWLRQFSTDFHNSFNGGKRTKFPTTLTQHRTFIDQRLIDGAIDEWCGRLHAVVTMLLFSQMTFSYVNYDVILIIKTLLFFSDLSQIRTFNFQKV